MIDLLTAGMDVEQIAAYLLMQAGIPPTHAIEGEETRYDIESVQMDVHKFLIVEGGQTREIRAANIEGLF